MSALQLINLTPEELASTIAETVKSQLQDTAKTSTDFIPAKTASELLGVSKTTLNSYVKKEVLTLYKFEGKAFYSLKEIESKMTPQNQ